MEHLSFLYYALAYSVSLPALVLVALAYLRTGERSLRSYVLFLASISFQLLCVALLRYLDAARIGSRAGAVSRHLYFFAESALVLAVPRVSHALLAVSKSAAWNRASGACFLACLALIASPFFVRYAPDGAAIYPRAGFFLYRGLFFAAMLYSIVRLAAGLGSLPPRAPRALIGFALASLTFTLWETLHCELLPVLARVPPTIALSPAGYLATNILLSVYVVRRHIAVPVQSAGPDRVLAALERSSLSDREREVAALLISGLRNREIGERLFISESTVKSHVKSVYRKLSVGSRVQLMNALRTGD